MSYYASVPYNWISTGCNQCKFHYKETNCIKLLPLHNSHLNSAINWKQLLFYIILTHCPYFVLFTIITARCILLRLLNLLAINTKSRILCTEQCWLFIAFYLIAFNKKAQLMQLNNFMCFCTAPSSLIYQQFCRFFSFRKCNLHKIFS